jgi:isochorismate synthase
MEPLTLARAASEAGYPVCYFRGREEIVGIGIAWRSEHPATPLPQGERFMFALPFDRGADWGPLGRGGVVLPTVTVVKNDAGTRAYAVPGIDARALIETLPTAESIVEPNAHVVAQVPSPATWAKLVTRAVGEIATGYLSKVVLARRVDVSVAATRRFDLLSTLRTRFPDTFLYGWSEEDASFLGASPELLIEKRGSSIRSFPLAGSARRGSNSEEDVEIAKALLAGSKEREEHEFVVDEIVRTLGEFTTDLTVPETPTVVRLPNIQHLGTEIVGTVAKETRVVRLAAALHPTPAVAGTPTLEAVRFIREVEPFDRGLYAGALGWTDSRGNGEAAIALRGTLLAGSIAKVYAGAGIVRDSVPDVELAETDAKLDAILDILVG